MNAVMRSTHLRRIRFWLGVFMVGLVISGVTAFPLEPELRWLVSLLHYGVFSRLGQSTHLLPWLDRVLDALTATNARYPFLAYGTDWLAFAHIVIATAFIGAWLDPVRNRWLVMFGLIACAGVVPLALIAGQVRGIPVGWRLIDCSFGAIGCIPLVICWNAIDAMERAARRRGATERSAAASAGATVYDGS